MTLTYQEQLARSMPEDELLTRVMDLMELHRFSRFHVRNSKAGVVQGDVGFPDVIALGHGRILAVELKSERGKATQAQMDWLLTFEEAGAEAYLWRPSHYLTGRIGAVLGGQK